MTEPLPRIRFEDVPLPISALTRDRWAANFPTYLINPALFDRDVMQQTRQLETLADFGMGDGGVKILEGLAPKLTVFTRYTGLLKAAAAAEMVAKEIEATEYEKIVIAAQHRDTLSEIRERLRSFGMVTCFGNTPEKKRKYIAAVFNRSPRCRVLGVHLAPHNVFPDLTVTNQMLVVGWAWKVEANLAAVIRMHNRRQTRPVRVRAAYIKDHIDHRVQQVLKQKTRRMVEDFDAGGEIVLPDPFS